MNSSVTNVNAQEPGAPSGTILIMAAAAGVSVANLYYNQPLLAQMGRTFHASVQHIGFIPTASQIGYALGLLFVVPLGDIVEHRKLTVILLGLVTISLVATALATTSAKGLTAALVEVARALETSGPLRTAATKEPALLAPLLVPGPARGWEALRTGLAGVLSAGHVPSGAGEVEVVLRWLTSQVLWPLELEQAAARADVLVRGLSGTPVSDTAVVAPAPVTTPDPVDRVGLGWPA